MGYRDRHEVADAMRNALRGRTVADAPQQIRSGMAVADLPKDWHFIERALAKATPADAAREVQELLPIVQTSLRDPDLYAEVIADAWERARRANGSIRDALVEMAKETGRRSRSSSKARCSRRRSSTSAMAGRRRTGSTIRSSSPTTAR